MVTAVSFIVLDAEALSLLANEDRQMFNWVTLARETGALFRISTITLAEAIDGSARDARIDNALRRSEVRVVEATKDIARLAGKLRTGVMSRAKA